ncbi:MAG: type I-C CRISPR-associated protein Cas5 [Planctomycetes bacterium]|nr:type I-C CRISPR-associated protein Cas5 [Planctomycetota bacterium]
MEQTVRLRVWGDLACFTRPEMKAERVSYDVMTPSAARGILEAVHWKPQIRWVVERIHVLKPIRFMSLRRNEVGSKVPVGKVEQAMKEGRGFLGLYVDDEKVRQQRAATVLRDVEYLIEARFEVLDSAEHPQKHFEVFKRRAEKGQCFQQPYLGTRELAAAFAWHEGPPPSSPLKGERDLGWMLLDLDYHYSAISA